MVTIRTPGTKNLMIFLTGSSGMLALTIFLTIIKNIADINGENIKSIYGGSL